MMNCARTVTVVTGSDTYPTVASVRLTDYMRGFMGSRL